MKYVLMLFGLSAFLVGYLAIPSRVSAAPDEALAKCGAPPVIILTDGKVLDESQFGAIPGSSIESIAVTCTDVRHLIFGVEEGRNLILAWTKAPPGSDDLNATMDAIASLEDAHFRQQGTYSRSLGELGWTGSTKVSLCVSQNGLRLKLLVANETGGGTLVRGTASDRNGPYSCDVRYPGAVDVLHWVVGEK